jgi:hypothetical protein
VSGASQRASPARSQVGTRSQGIILRQLQAAAKPEQFIREKQNAKPFQSGDATRWSVKYRRRRVHLQHCHYNHTVIEYGLSTPTVAPRRVTRQGSPYRS